MKSPRKSQPKAKALTKAMTAQRCAEIINDIHEGMCRASRKELMECASFYSLRCCTLYQAASSAYTQQAIDGLAGLNKFRAEHNK